MDKFNFVKNGESKLPPGFRFEPTDEEIVFQYLARKTFSFPLPATVIPEINILCFDPWHLPGELEQERYFFSNKETNYRNNVISMSSRASCGGYWKKIGSDKLISCRSKRIPIVGIKKTLVFYKGKHPRTTRTDFFMNIYCIAAVLQGNTPCNNIPYRKRNYSQGSNLIQVGQWVLCHVFFKKRSSKARDYDNDKLRNYNNFNSKSEISDTNSSSSSSFSSDSADSSVVSEISSTSANSEAKCP